MISITEIQNKETNKIANLLRDYWKERGLNFTLKSIKNHITIYQKRIFAIKLNKKIIGTVSLNIKNDLAEIKDFMIEKSQRGKGYGADVLKFIILYCKSRNIRKLFSLILPRYKMFFDRFSFVQEGTLRNHFIDKEDVIVMSRFLAVEKQLNLKDEINKISISNITSQRLSNLKY